LAGVLATFSTITCPLAGSSSTRSVWVPPTSTPRRYCAALKFMKRPIGWAGFGCLSQAMEAFAKGNGSGWISVATLTLAPLLSRAQRSAS